tara:strand:+ start:1840 stop:2058 length:219 start_codon:yes stop_codon:yes gene_type:complete
MTKKIIVETFVRTERHLKYVIDVPDDAPETLEGMYSGEHDDLLEEIEKKIKAAKGEVIESWDDDDEIHEIRR